jgi:hypothetical protein
MRSLYLARLFNVGNHIKCVQFLANEIEIIYVDNSQKQFCYQKLGAEEDLTFASEVSCGIDTILEVSQNPCKYDSIYQVKYEELHVFSPESISNKGIKIYK